MSIFQNKTTRTLILVMCVLVAFGIVIARQYYGNLNKSIDPRIIEAREMYKKYDRYAMNNRIDSVFILLDSIEAIYSAIPHYTGSYEFGVLNNNRAAAYLTLALYSPIYSVDSIAQDSLIRKSEHYSHLSIEIYRNWLDKNEKKSEAELRKFVQADFVNGLEDLDNDYKERIINRRVDELIEAQTETKRRLSVSYTNLGIVYRHYEHYEQAAESYTTALKLWDQNLTAENNLNILLGKPLKKRTLLQKLFPPNK